MGDYYEPSPSLSGLLCQESMEEALEEPVDNPPGRDRVDESESVFEDDESVFFYSESFITVDEVEYIRQLVERETTVGFRTNASFTDYPNQNVSWQGRARLEVIRWIFNARIEFGFQIHTAYLSLTFFDRFLAKRPIEADANGWGTRLVSVACFTLAAKMEELRPPNLGEIIFQRRYFSKKLIKNTEILVLDTLQYQMGPITPFVYLHYFICQFYGDFGPRELVSRALEHIVAIIQEMRLVDHRPSFIAAAAALAAYNLPLTKEQMELKMQQFIPFWGSLEYEHIFSCYNTMLQIGFTPTRDVLSEDSSRHSGSDDDDDDDHHHPDDSAPRCKGVGAKRRLTFDNGGSPGKISRQARENLQSRMSGA